MKHDIEKTIKGLHDISGWITGRLGYEQAKNFLNTIDNVIELLKKQIISDEIHETAKQFRRTIIQCKDCVHRDPEDKKCDCGHDIQWQLPRKDDWFCADGKHRD